MSIAIIGQGFVGGSLTSVLAERGESVFTFDKLGKNAEGGINKFLDNSTKSQVKPESVADFTRYCEKMPEFTGIYFVCVPTPMYEDGSADISIVEAVLREIADAPHESKISTRIAVVKSTVPPGSTANWNKIFNDKQLYVVFNPEFLTEANAINDMRSQNRIVLGGPRPHINSVKNLFQRHFPNIPIIKTGSTTAEMVKYVTNCFLAVKVSFANEISQICESLDSEGYNIDYDKVIEYAKFDNRLGESHWSVPGPVLTHDGRFVKGFGGHCFPKDINALMHVAKNQGINPTVMKAAWDKNLEIRGPDDRDWEKQIGRAVSKRQNLDI